MPFDRIFLDELSARNDIVDVVSQYVQLKKSGANYFGLCPFHNEKTGSFSVSPDKQIFHCFGCGAGGGVITFVMKAEGLSFPDAVRYLADRAGMQVPEQGEEERRAARHRDRLYALCRDAARFYYDTLWKPENRAPQQYFIGRGLSRRTMNRFGLGYAPDSFHALMDAMTAKGYTRDELLDAGLVSRSEKGRIYDRFRNRVMFPIIDVRGNVIAFGGRVMDDSKPKYLNSPETPIFHKSRNLFALNLSKTTKNDYFILAEGYMDVIALHQAGFDSAVASLGTSLTEEQARIIARHTERIVISYDADGAGQSAAQRAIDILKKCDLQVKVLRIPGAKDPDEFIKNLGTEAFQERIDQAENSFYFEIRILSEQYDQSDPEQRTKFHREIAQKLCEFSEDLERENYLQAIAEKYMIRPDDLRKMVIGYASQTGIARPIPRPRSGVQNKSDPSESGRKSQRLLITWIGDDPSLYTIVRKYISLEDFTEELYRKVAEKMFAELDNGQFQPAGIISMFEDEEEQRQAAELFHTTLPELSTKQERERAFHDILVSVKRNSYQYYMAQLGTDVNAVKKAVEGKKALEELQRARISLE